MKSKLVMAVAVLFVAGMTAPLMGSTFAFPVAKNLGFVSDGVCIGFESPTSVSRTSHGPQQAA